MKRRLWQIISTILHNSYYPALVHFSLYQGFLKGYCTPTLNCYACPSAFLSCPIGALQHFAIKRQFPFLLIGFFGLVGAGVGRMICAWLCPFGLLQDAMKKLSSRVLALPKWMGELKYVSLVVVAILIPFLLGEPWFSKLCPQGAVEGAIPWAAVGTPDTEELAGLDVRSMIGMLFWIKIAILGVFLIGMVFIKRPFCRIACPLGAIFSFFNRMSLVRLHVLSELCDGCGYCVRVCPVDIVPYRDVDARECIKCLECTRCPKGAIVTTFGFSKRGAIGDRD